MKFNKFVAPVMAGALALSLGLTACGGSNSTETTTTEDASTTTTEDTSKTTSETTSTTTDAATTTEDKIVFWDGETDKGDTLLYTEDEKNDTASIILFGSHDDNTELLAYSGSAKLEGDKVTITDSETGDTFSFTITGATDDALTIDLGEHGSGTLKPVTEKEFNEAVDGIVAVATQVGEQLESLSDQDIEDLLNILEILANDSGTTDSAAQTSK